MSAHLKLLIHDFCGHPFQAQLSRELARSGLDVIHAYCSSYTTGRGALGLVPDDPVGLSFVPVSMGDEFDKYSARRRLKQEIGYAVALYRLVRQQRPDVLVMCNTPLGAHALLTLLLLLPRRRRAPRVLYWHQDVISSAMRTEAVKRLGRPGLLVGFLAERVERWLARSAQRIVVIAETFLAPHRRWGTVSKTRVIPNWAPLGDIVPGLKDNAWSREHGLSDRAVVMYAGTLGLKHNPDLLVAIGRILREHLPQARMVVVSEGVGADHVKEHGLDLPVVVLPFQDFTVLPDVLATADVLVTLLEPEASDFSVPSKTLTYLCSGRAVLGFMRPTNPAATLIRRGGGAVFDIEDLDMAVVSEIVLRLLTQRAVVQEAGRVARALAESEFDINSIGQKFRDEIFATAATRR